MRELVLHVAMDTFPIFRPIETDIAATIVSSERLRAEIDMLLRSEEEAHRALATHRALRGSVMTRH